MQWRLCVYMFFLLAIHCPGCAETAPAAGNATCSVMGSSRSIDLDRRPNHCHALIHTYKHLVQPHRRRQQRPLVAGGRRSCQWGTSARRPRPPWPPPASVWVLWEPRRSSHDSGFSINPRPPQPARPDDTHLLDGRQRRGRERGRARVDDAARVAAPGLVAAAVPHEHVAVSHTHGVRRDCDESVRSTVMVMVMLILRRGLKRL